MDYLIDFKDSDTTSIKKAYFDTLGSALGQFRADWITLEPTEGVYNFASIQEVVDTLGEENVVVMIRDKTFGTDTTDPNPTHVGSFVTGTGGYCAYRWTTRYRRHFNALQRNLSAAFPNLGGIAYQESSMGVGGTSAMSVYSADAYRDNLIEIIEQGLDLFRSVRWYFNFFDLDNSSKGGKNYIRAVIDEFEIPGSTNEFPDNFWIGGPDILPNNSSLVNVVYPIYGEYPNINKFCSAQPDTFKSYTIADFPDEIIDYADTELGVILIPLTTVDFNISVENGGVSGHAQIDEVLGYISNTRFSLLPP